MSNQFLFLMAIAVRTAIVLVVLVFAIRLSGKRDLGGLNLLDVVMVLMIGNAVQNALTTGSGRLGVGVISVLVLLLVDRQLGTLIAGRPKLERVMIGDPTVLVVDGQLDRAAMDREEVDEEEIMAAMRETGLAEIGQVRLAMLEPNGEISIIPKEEDRPATG